MKKLLFALGWLLLAASTQAAAPNSAWFYNGGYFVKDRQTGGWSETIGDTETFYFKQIGANSKVVVLFDAIRGMTVQLEPGAMFLKAMGETKFTFYKSGNWDNRTLFSYDLGGGRSGYYQLIGGDMYRHIQYENGGKHSSYLRNDGRGPQTINLLYPLNHTSYAIQGNELFIETKPGHWTKLFSGIWN